MDFIIRFTDFVEIRYEKCLIKVCWPVQIFTLTDS
jgi:hypothetical protein